MNGPMRTALADLQKIRGFAVLVLDGRKWLLPQTEIRLLGSLLDIDREVQAPGSIGAFALEDEWWPVYCLSGELQLLPQLSANRRVCPLLSNGADRFGVVCDRIESLVEPPRLAALPACMASPGSPVQALALLGEGLGCATTTEHLAALIAAVAENADA